jgi:hypothetical protein
MGESVTLFAKEAATREDGGLPTIKGRALVLSELSCDRWRERAVSDMSPTSMDSMRAPLGYCSLMMVDTGRAGEVPVSAPLPAVVRSSNDEYAGRGEPPTSCRPDRRPGASIAAATSPGKMAMVMEPARDLRGCPSGLTAGCMPGPPPSDGASRSSAKPPVLLPLRVERGSASVGTALPVGEARPRLPLGVEGAEAVLWCFTSGPPPMEVVRFSLSGESPPPPREPREPSLNSDTRRPVVAPAPAPLAERCTVMATGVRCELGTDDDCCDWD